MPHSRRWSRWAARTVAPRFPQPPRSGACARGHVARMRAEQHKHEWVKDTEAWKSCGRGRGPRSTLTWPSGASRRP